MPKKIDALHAAVQDMDGIGQGALGSISTIAKLTLAWLETPSAYAQWWRVADALESIQAIADTAEIDLSNTAQSVEAAHSNYAALRRQKAYEQAQLLSKSCTRPIVGGRHE